MERPVRKDVRLPEYDYSQPGGYFVTVCTRNRENLFWTDTETSLTENDPLPLTPLGKTVCEAIEAISSRYSVEIVCSVVMPNHVHFMLLINTDQNGMVQSAPSLAEIVRQFKGAVTKCAGYPIWQKNYYEHVIRGSKDANSIMRYIMENPLRWNLDDYWK